MYWLVPNIIKRSISIHSQVDRVLFKNIFLIKLIYWSSLLLFIIFQIIYGYFRSYNYSFDEFNTLNIITLSFNQINQILRLEQNFPTYYFLLKTFSVIPLPIYLLNLFIWLISLVSFYFFSKTIFNTNLNIYLVNFMFCFSVSINMYATYIRMYGLLLLIFIWINYFLINKDSKFRKFRYFIVLLLLTSTFVGLHPTAILILPLIFYLYKPSNPVYKYILILVPFSIYLIYILPKNILVFMDGTLYLKDFSQPFYYFLSYLFFTSVTPFSLLWSFIVLILFVLSIKRYLENPPHVISKFYIIVYIVILISLFLRTYVNIRHFSFLLVYFLPVLVDLLKYNNRIFRYYFGLITVFVFLFSNLFFYYYQLSSMSSMRDLCEGVSRLNSSTVVISSFRLINTFQKCAPNLKFAIVFNKDGVVSVPLSDRFTSIAIQAKTGGFYTLLPLRAGYINFLDSNFFKIQNNIKEKTSGYNDIAYIPEPGLNSKTSLLYGLELQLFEKDFVYVEEKMPGIFIFKHKVAY